MSPTIEHKCSEIVYGGNNDIESMSCSCGFMTDQDDDYPNITAMMEHAAEQARVELMREYVQSNP